MAEKKMTMDEVQKRNVELMRQRAAQKKRPARSTAREVGKPTKWDTPKKK